MRQEAQSQGARRQGRWPPSLYVKPRHPMLEPGPRPPRLTPIPLNFPGQVRLTSSKWISSVSTKFLNKRREPSIWGKDVNSAMWRKYYLVTPAALKKKNSAKKKRNLGVPPLYRKSGNFARENFQPKGLQMVFVFNIRLKMDQKGLKDLWKD